MSVAFRRESDEEHLEPKFELPLPPGPNLVTPRGLALIEAKVAEWNVAVANAPDDEARKAANRDLRYWNTRLATARVAPPPPPDSVAIGSHVTFRLNGAEQTINIVGQDESDPSQGRIAFAAPLVHAMIGARVGDMLDFAGSLEAIEILSVETSPH